MDLQFVLVLILLCFTTSFSQPDSTVDNTDQASTSSTPTTIKSTSISTITTKTPTTTSLKFKTLKSTNTFTVSVATTKKIEDEDEENEEQDDEDYSVFEPPTKKKQDTLSIIYKICGGTTRKCLIAYGPNRGARTVQQAQKMCVDAHPKANLLELYNEKIKDLVQRFMRNLTDVIDPLNSLMLLNAEPVLEYQQWIWYWRVDGGQVQGITNYKDSDTTVKCNKQLYLRNMTVVQKGCTRQLRALRVVCLLEFDTQTLDKENELTEGYDFTKAILIAVFCFLGLIILSALFISALHLCCASDTNETVTGGAMVRRMSVSMGIPQRLSQSDSNEMYTQKSADLDEFSAHINPSYSGFENDSKL